MRVREDRSQVFGQIMMTTREHGRAHETTRSRQHGQNNEWERHRSRRLVQVALLLRSAAKLTEEDQEKQAKHIERREQGREQAHGP